MTITTPFEWRPLDVGFGAEVDLDLKQELTPEAASSLRQLFDDRQLLVFRDQTFSHSRQADIAALFGHVIPDTVYISNEMSPSGAQLDEPDNNVKLIEYHSDNTFLEYPIHGVGLWGEKVLPTSAATQFISNRNAYLGLADAQRERFEGLVTVHAFILDGYDSSYRNTIRFAELPDTALCAEHPLLYPNPRTGDKVLFYTQMFAHSIVGMADGDAREVFEDIETILYADAEVYAHHWRPNDFVMWDNIALQHSRENVAETPDRPVGRTLRRVAIGDDRMRPYYEQV